MIILLGVVGTNEIILLGGLLLLPILFYWIGRRSGYRKGQLDMYREREKKEKE